MRPDHYTREVINEKLSILTEYASQDRFIIREEGEFIKGPETIRTLDLTKAEVLLPPMSNIELELQDADQVHPLNCCGFCSGEYKNFELPNRKEIFLESLTKKDQ